jgi:ketosteroid isomerase-like protein
MSQENVEITRTSYEALNRRDVDALLEHLDPNIEVPLPEGGIMAGVLRGHQGVRAFLDSYLDAFECFHVQPERFFDAGDRIVVFCRMSGLGRGSGAAIKARPAHLWTMRGGKAVRLEVIPERERERALQAVGLRE